MTVEAATPASLPAEANIRPIVHPRWVRLTHWINAVAMVVMIMS
jgi:Ni,Fe-hydrogenase I cytochrome b subunit